MENDCSEALVVEKQFAVSLPVIAYLPLMPAGMLFHMAQFLLLNLLLLLQDVLCRTIFSSIFYCYWCTEARLSYLCAFMWLLL